MQPTGTQIIDEAARLVSEGIIVTLPVRGRSMLPFIVGDRDSVILRRPDHLRPGDVVLAWVDGCRYVLHRIIAIDGADIALMGDGNLMGIERCTVADVKARATHIVDSRGKKRYLYTRRCRLVARIWCWMRPVRRYLLPVFGRIAIRRRN